jgi:hypothetical protein
MFAQQPYTGGYAAYQPPVMNYQPQYVGQPQPQVIIIKQGTQAQKPYNPYTQYK